MFRKKKTKRKGLMALLDRLMMLSVIIPPGYIIYRFIRWYSHQDEPDVDDYGDES